MVFQHFNLFPNMTVLKNITLAPVRLGKWKAEAGRPERARKLLKRVGLEREADVYPGQLSGGQEAEGCDCQSTGDEPGSTAVR